MTKRAWTWVALVTVVVIGAAMWRLSLPGSLPPPADGSSQESGAGPQENPWTLAEAARPYSGQTIRLIGEDYPPLHAIEALKGSFEEATGIQVEVEGYEAEAVLQKVALDLASGAGQYDLVIQIYFDMGRLVEQGQVQPLTSFLNDPKLRDPNFKPEEDLFPVWKTMGWYQGKAYGLPMMVLTMYTWYRADLFENPKEQEAFYKRYGYSLAPPADWKQYRDIAEFFTRPSERLYGTLIQGKRHIALWQEYLNFLYSFGGEILDTDDPSKYGPIAINSPEAVKATEYYKSMLRYSPPDSLNFTWDDALALMQQGKVAMCLMWNDSSYALEDSEQSRVAGKMAYSLVPQGPAGVVQQVGGQSYYLPTASKHAQAAYLFIQWMLSHEIQVSQQALGGSSARRSVYQVPEVLKLPWTATNIAAMDSPHPPMLYTFPESLQIGEVIKSSLSGILAGETGFQEGLDEAAIDIKRVLGDKAELAYEH